MSCFKYQGRLTRLATDITSNSERLTTKQVRNIANADDLRLGASEFETGRLFDPYLSGDRIRGRIYRRRTHVLVILSKPLIAGTI